MKFKKPINENYCANVVEIKTIFPLEKCDNIQGTVIFGTNIIIGKDVKIGDIGIFFPAGTQLSRDYTHFNNLHRHPELNADEEKKGYLEDNRRIRAMKMRGNESCGLFMPLESLSFVLDDVSELNVGDTFDEIKSTLICNKYIIKKRTPGGHNKTKGKKVKKESRLIENQFRFHADTTQLGKNVHHIKPNDLISVTYKLHGTSGISSKVLCKKKLGIYQQFLKLIGGDITTTEYFNLYSSRRVVKNDDMNLGKQGYYNIDIWEIANKKLEDYLLDGMTIYYEIVGFLPDGQSIQKMKKAFDYGCKTNEFEIYIYRITITNTAGNVFEFSAKQVQDWCYRMNLKAVPELFYGRADKIFEFNDGYSPYYYDDLSFEDNFLNTLKEKYLDKNCYMCKNRVPAEGIVVRKETFGLYAWKYKSFKFLNAETEQLDKGVSNMEDEN